MAPYHEYYSQFELTTSPNMVNVEYMFTLVKKIKEKKVADIIKNIGIAAFTIDRNILCYILYIYNYLV